MPINQNMGGYIVSHSRRGIDMRMRVKTEALANEVYRSMQQDNIVDLNKIRYYFGNGKILIVHIPNLKCETYDSIYGLRDPYASP